MVDFFDSPAGAPSGVHIFCSPAAGGVGAVDATSPICGGAEVGILAGFAARGSIMP